MVPNVPSPVRLQNNREVKHPTNCTLTKVGEGKVLRVYIDSVVLRADEAMTPHLANGSFALSSTCEFIL